MLKVDAARPREITQALRPGGRAARDAVEQVRWLAADKTSPAGSASG